MKMNSRYRFMYDAASKASLRAQGQADITADAAGSELVFDELTGYWTDAYNELADQSVAVVANVTKADFTTADETYTLNLVTNNGVTVATAKVTGVGQYVLFVDMGTLRLSDPTAASFSLDADVGGTTPILNFFAWLTQIAK
jgi:hypothetical protein